MNTKSIKYFTATLFAYMIACAVILSHTHAADLLKQARAAAPANVVKATDAASKLPDSPDRTNDVGAKAMGDLHTHIDKTMLKNVMKTATDTTAARRSELERSEISDDESLMDRFLNSLLLLRVMLTLPMSV